MTCLKYLASIFSITGIDQILQTGEAKFSPTDLIVDKISFIPDKR